MDLVTLILIVLSTARLTRLVTTDRVTQAVRLWVVTRVDEDGPIAYFIDCPWCVSIYIGTAVSAAAYAFGDSPFFSVAALALSASHITGWLASREDD